MSMPVSLSVCCAGHSAKRPECQLVPDEEKWPAEAGHCPGGSSAAVIVRAQAPWVPAQSYWAREQPGRPEPQARPHRALALPGPPERLIPERALQALWVLAPSHQAPVLPVR